MIPSTTTDGGVGGDRTLAPLLRPNGLANRPLHRLSTTPYRSRRYAAPKKRDYEEYQDTKIEESKTQNGRTP